VTSSMRISLGMVVSSLLMVHQAHAQGFVEPSLGVTLANASGQGRANIGVAAGFLAPRDPIGAELDVVYAPSFFGNAGGLGDNSVTTVMANIIVAGGHPGGRGFVGKRPPSLRPYVSGGAGVMHEVSTGPGTARISGNDLGLNLGAGVMGFMRRSIGLRGDVRYYRNLVSDQTTGGGGNIDFGAFHLWRASLGVLFGF
jgi:hypothetical protein